MRGDGKVLPVCSKAWTYPSHPFTWRRLSLTLPLTRFLWRFFMSPYLHLFMSPYLHLHLRLHLSPPFFDWRPYMLIWGTMFYTYQSHQFWVFHSKQLTCEWVCGMVGLLAHPSWSCSLAVSSATRISYSSAAYLSQSDGSGLSLSKSWQADRRDTHTHTSSWNVKTF